jgi:hypothetical protein
MNHLPQPSIGQPSLLPGLARVVEADQRVRLALADLQARDADQDREQTLDLAEPESTDRGLMLAG